MWTTGPEQQGDEMGMEIPLPPSLCLPHLPFASPSFSVAQTERLLALVLLGQKTSSDHHSPLVTLASTVYIYIYLVCPKLSFCRYPINV